MIPGPVKLEENVLKKMSLSLEPHYGPEWAEYYNETVERAKEILHTKHETSIHVGTGHASLDAAINCFAASEKKILILNNGHWATRIREIVEEYDVEYDEIIYNWNEQINPKDVEEKLRNNSAQYSLVAMVHTETSTGVKNSVKEIAKIAAEYDVITLVDAVCSVGSDMFKMDDWHIDITVTASQKGLGAPPGLTIISVSDKAWEFIEDHKEKIHGWYVNLLVRRRFAEEYRNWQPYSMTMAVNNFKALDQAFKNIISEGLEERVSRHARIAESFRKKLRSIGYELWVDSSIASNSLTTVKIPDKIDSGEIVNSLKKDYNIYIGSGLGKLEGDIIRVGHMNAGASHNCISPVIWALKELKEKF